MNTRRFALMLGLVAMVLLVAPGKSYADFYDDFSDGSYSEPNWNLDDPQWWFYNLDTPSNFADANYGAVRIVAFANPYLPVIGVCAISVDDLDYDPLTSETWWDDTTNHYVLCKLYYPGYYGDPNDPMLDRGVAKIVMHADAYTWQSFGVDFTFHNCAYREPNLSKSWEDENHYNEHINLVFTDGPAAVNIQRLWIDPNGRRPDGVFDPNYSDPNDTMKLTPPEGRSGNPYRIPAMDTTKFLGYDFDAMERNGFWLLLQFEIDPNYPSGDPHGKWLRSAFWEGDKYDWDGEWLLSYQLSDPPWTSGDPNTLYTPDGFVGIAALTGNWEQWGAGFPADFVFDDVEGRTAIWNGVARQLNLTIANNQYGQVDVIPDLPAPADTYDPNTVDPNDPNTFPEERLLRYTDGTEVTLVAESVPDRSFKNWTIFDPNYPGDREQATLDTNAVLYLTMDMDYDVEAAFSCGSGLPPFVAMSMLALGLGVVIRRIL